MSSSASDLATVRTFLDGHRAPTSVRDQLYRLYLTVLFGAIAYVVVVVPITGAVPPAGIVELFERWAPGTLAAVGAASLLVGARAGVWAGPVLLARADADWLLDSPLPRDSLLRPHLIVGLLAGSGLGAVVGLVVGLGVVFVSATSPWTVLPAAVIGWAALGALAAVVSWYVESSPGAAALVMRTSPLVVLGMLAMVAVGGGSHATLWTGPWGWASLPALGAAGYAVTAPTIGAVLLLVTAVGASSLALRDVGTAHHEQLAQRAGLHHGLVASAYVLDLRAMSLIREERQRSASIDRTVRLRAPRSPRLAVMWRDAVAVAKRPSRVVWAVALVSAGVGIAATAPGTPAVIAAAAATAYLGAARLLEPLRIEIDDPSHAELLPVPYPRLVLGHTVLPTIAVAAAGAVGVATFAIAGVIPAGSVPLALVLVPGAGALLVVSGGLANIRDHSPLDYLQYGEYGIVPMIGSVIKGPMLAAILVAAPLTVVHALELSAGSAVVALVVYSLAAPAAALARLRSRVRSSVRDV